MPPGWSSRRLSPLRICPRAAEEMDQGASRGGADLFASVAIFADDRNHMYLLAKLGRANFVPNYRIPGNQPHSEKTQVDLYYIGQDRQSGAFQRGTGHGVRDSLGVRASRPVVRRDLSVQIVEYR
jgi:hypothetical protein